MGIWGMASNNNNNDNQQHNTTSNELWLGSPFVAPLSRSAVCGGTANLPTNIVDFKGFDSSVNLILRGGIPRPKGDLPERLTQAMLVGCNVSREIGRMEHLWGAVAPLRGRSLNRCLNTQSFALIPRESFSEVFSFRGCH